MANGKAEITDIDLSNISVNLTEYLSNIQPYNGFIQCNSPWVGGMVNNVYKKNLRIRDGHKFVRIKDGDLYTVFGTGLYKNYEKIGNIKTGYFAKVPYKDPYITETDIKVLVNYNGQTVEFEKHLDYSYDYVEIDGILYVTVAPAFSTSLSDFTSVARTYAIDATGVNTLTGANMQYVYSQALHTVDLSGATAIQYDPSGLIVDTSSGIRTYYTDSSSVNKTGSVSNVLHADGVSYWTRGEKLKTKSGFDVLYYNKFVSGISYNNSVLTYDVDRIVHVGEDYIVYEDPNGNKWKLFIAGSNFPMFSVDDDFIYFNTISYENTYSFQTGLMFCRSDDYNDRILICGTSSGLGLWATGYHSNAIEQNFQNFATAYPAVSHNLGGSYAMFLEDDYIHPIEIFRPTVSGGAAVYDGSLVFASQLTYSLHKDVTLVGTTFAINSSYNTLYNTPVLMEIADTYINEKVGIVQDHSYIIAKSQRQENILGYYEFTLSEIKQIFLIQGSFYGINDRFIFRIGVSDSVLSINGVAANKLDLEFLGAFPQYALFYSKLDKSLYSFTGDENMAKIKECYRINEIKQAYCDPSRLTMIISTDIGTLIVYQNQMFLLEDLIPEGKIFYDNNNYVVGEYLLSFRQTEGFECMPIKMQTSFYGIGGSVKSINDCVYIKVAKNEIEKGYLKIKSYAMNSECTESNEKTYNLFASDFDKITRSMFIRYQPQRQSASGFSIKLESTSPIVSISIGHTPEAIQNTKYNL